MRDVTQILDALREGQTQASEELIPLVYDELRRLAAYQLAREKPGQTLQATALVHEAYLRLLKSAEPAWRDHRHFFSAAAQAMRRILIDNARRKQRQRDAVGGERVGLERIEPAIPPPSDDLLALNDALERLEAVDAEAAELVQLRFFVGLTMEQAAAALDISERSAYSLWSFARAWLYRDLQS